MTAMHQLILATRAENSDIRGDWAVEGKSLGKRFAKLFRCKSLGKIYVITTLQINSHDIKHDGMYAKYNIYLKYENIKSCVYIYMDYILYCMSQWYVYINLYKPSKLDRCMLYHTCTYVIHSLLEFSTPIWASKWFTWGISWVLTWNWHIDIFIVYTGNEKYMAQPRHIGLYGAFKLY